MAIIGISLQWYDVFFLSVFTICAFNVAIHWEKYHNCAYPLHLWTVVDYCVVFIFRLLMFVDNALAAGLGPDNGEEQRHVCFCGRVIVLAILGMLLYPFLFASTIIGTLWFAHAKSCLSGKGQKISFVIWLIFSYCGLLGIQLICIVKWSVRRQAHHFRARQGNTISEIGVLVDLIQVPDGASDAAGQEMGDMVRYGLGRHLLTQAQRQVVETHIQELPKIELKAVPSDCTECSICLEELQIGNEVRGLPCAHNFHAECIDKWLRLNAKCPRCRCSVFPGLDLSAILQEELLYILRLQSLLRPHSAERARSGGDVEDEETETSTANVSSGHENEEIVRVMVE